MDSATCTVRWAIGKVNGIDSGATSHFVQNEDNLPIIGPAHKQVQMPNSHMETVSCKAKLPYAMLCDNAREAHVLPALTHHLLLSIPMLVNEGYTTVFHVGEKGAEVYKAEAIKIHTTSPPVLQGCRNSQRLWTVTSTKNVTSE